MNQPTIAFQGCTALHRAARTGRFLMVSMLVAGWGPP
ncbi:hypothetical protein AB0M43_10450 [Longispora sp. NPDC051575]